MGFTTPCFIRKNTKELRDKLEELGYYEIYVSVGDDIYSNLKTGADMSGNICRYMQWYQDKNTSSIDCGTNEELFLAISALRDDTDIHQWFIMDIEAYLNLPKGKWFKATSLGGGHHVGCQIEPFYCHKATVEELINHFKI